MELGIGAFEGAYGRRTFRANTLHLVDLGGEWRECFEGARNFLEALEFNKYR